MATRRFRLPFLPRIMLLQAALVVATALPACGHAAQMPGTPPELQESGTPRFRVAVDEVSLRFHANDARGLPVDDLRPDELDLLDNGRPPRRIVELRLLRNLPLRAGLLMDVSACMDATRAADRAIAERVARQVLRASTDAAFVIRFNAATAEVQPWTNQADALAMAVSGHTRMGADALRAGSRTGGTALFDSIYRTCLDQFSHADAGSSGNFLLLFSDGEDNASRTTLEQAVDICQRNHTAIYAFRPGTAGGPGTGASTLAQLTRQSGGRVFFDDDSGAAIERDLRTLEADLRNEYQLTYNPPPLRHDGSFHRIELQLPNRVAEMVAGSGYYAPVR